MLLMEGGHLLGACGNMHSMIDCKEPQVDDCWYYEGTICLVNKWIGAKGMVSSVGARMGAINGWYLGLVAPISSIVWLLILYG